MEALYKKIYNDLYFKIQSGDYKAGDTLPTEADLCAQYGVSRITAIHALNELRLHGLVERKRRKGTVVLQSTFLPRGKAHSIAVVFSYFDNYETKIVNSLTPFAQKKNCSVITFDSQRSRDKEREILKHLLSQKIIGLIIWPVARSSNLDLLNQFVLDNTPICFLDNSSYGIKAPRIASDNYEAMYNLTKYLISIGHRHIAYFPYKENFLPTEEERFSGYCRAVVKNGASLNPDYFITMPPAKSAPPPESEAYFEQCAEHAIDTVLQLKIRPSALICVNDATAYNVICCARRRGLRVPEDLSVTGFDNVALAAQNDITTVSQDFGEMAKMALSMIFYQLNNPTLINNYSGTNRINFVLWERGSTTQIN